jgi:TonB family protein
MKISALTFALCLAVSPACLAHQETSGGETAGAPTQSTAQPQRIRIGGNVQAAKLIHQPLPVYPQIAKTAHIEGTVVIHAIIAKDGTVKEAQYVSGPPLLLRSAMDAVKQWVYEPTTLQGQPVEVDTTISVVFTLGSSPKDTGTTNIDPAFRSDVLHMLEITHAQEKAQTGMRAMFDGMRASLTTAMPATPNRDKIVTAYEEKFISLVEKPEFTEGIVAVYAKYFTDEDIKALIEFYQTPAGQHASDHLGDVMADSVKFGEQLATENLERIFAELCAEYPELKGEAKFCPASDEKSSRLILPTPRQPQVIAAR